MFDDLNEAVDALFPTIKDELGDLVRIPTVSAKGFDPGQVRRGADRCATRLEEAGLVGVRLLEVEGAHPAVFGEVPGPTPDVPTVLLYAHYDVQPAGPVELWSVPPFDLTERGGRLFGRGAADDKCGVVIHTGAIRAHSGRPPVGVKVFLEGEEEIGSAHLHQFLASYHEDLAADVIVVADAANWSVGVPALTTSLRGLVDCTIEVRTLESGVHSGLWGGLFPDALTVLIRALGSLHDDSGNVAVKGLVKGPRPSIEADEEECRQQAKALSGVETIGTGSITERLWNAPSISVLGLDASPVEGAINQLIPSARAKVSLRLAPGDHPDTALDALTDHLTAAVPWGASVRVEPGTSAHPFALTTSGPAYQAFGAGFHHAYGREAVHAGIGGAIPFVQAFSETFPGAELILTGAADPTSAIHGPNESVNVDDLAAAVLVEAAALRALAS